MQNSEFIKWELVILEFKEDIFPEHKDKIGGLVQFVNLPYESAVEYAWDQLRVTQKGVNFPVRTDYVVSSGEFVEKISIRQDSFLVVETINPRWIAVMGTGKFAVANRFLLPSNTAFWGDSYPISKEQRLFLFDKIMKFLNVH